MQGFSVMRFEAVILQSPPTSKEQLCGKGSQTLMAPGGTARFGDTSIFKMYLPSTRQMY